MAGYAWANLPQGSTVVDVGGGVGAQSLTLATHHPHLRFIVQDLPSVVTPEGVDVRARSVRVIVVSENGSANSFGRTTCQARLNPAV